MKDNQETQGYATLKDVLAYLTGRCRLKVTMALLKKRSRDGLLTKNEDGRWNAASVDMLAQTLVKADEAGDGPADLAGVPSGELPAIKLRREIARLDAQIESIRRENEVKAGKLFKKSEIYLELAHRASVFYAGLSQSLNDAVPAILRAALEDPARGEELLRQAIEEALARGINTFARPLALAVEVSARSGQGNAVPASD